MSTTRARSTWSSWGIQSPRDVTTGKAAAKFKLNEVVIVKRIDRASPVLMQLAKHNKPVEVVTLTLRKSGSTQLTFLIVELKNARVTAVNVQCENSVASMSTDVVERVNLGFDHVTITTPQASTGGKGDVVFEADSCLTPRAFETFTCRSKPPNAPSGTGTSTPRCAICRSRCGNARFLFQLLCRRPMGAGVDATRRRRRSRRRGTRDEADVRDAVLCETLRAECSPANDRR